MNTESESESFETEAEEHESTEQRRKKKKKYQQKFNADWKRKYSWIKESEKGNLFFKCTACMIHLKATTVGFRRHDVRSKHIANMNAAAKSKQQGVLFFQQGGSLLNQVKENEIRLAFYFVEHNIAIQNIDHLTPLLKMFDPKSEILKRMSCGRTKLTCIINNVTGLYAKNLLIDKLKQIPTPFSLIIDGSTDRSTQKTLALVVRTVSKNKIKKCYSVHDEFIALLDVKDFTAVGLFTSVTDFFKVNEIPYKSNLFGFAADGENTMMGRNNSVKTLLEGEVPNIIILKCICHSLAKCASYATTKLPNYVEEFVKGVYAYVKFSSKRQQALSEIQDLMNEESHKILKCCDTRWLSMYQCVHRIVEQYAVLKQFFHNEFETTRGRSFVTERQEKTANIDILNALVNNIFVEFYLRFLDYVLPLVCHVNMNFQSETLKIHTLYPIMETLYRTLLSNYMKPEYIKNNSVEVIQFKNPEHFKNRNVYFGPQATEFLELHSHKIKSADLKLLNPSCLNFYVELCAQIYQRFPFTDCNVKLLKNLQFVSPDKIETLDSISNVAVYFKTKLGNFDSIQAEIEFQMLKNDVQLDFSLPVLDFWYQVSLQVRGDDSPLYPNIIQLVEAVFCLPHSNAAVEIMFSVVNRNKTDLRNRLQNQTMSGILHTKNFLRISDSTCYEVDIPMEMVKHHNASIYSDDK